MGQTLAAVGEVMGGAQTSCAAPATRPKRAENKAVWKSIFVKAVGYLEVGFKVRELILSSSVAVPFILQNLRAGTAVVYSTGHHWCRTLQSK